MKNMSFGAKIMLVVLGLSILGVSLLAIGFYSRVSSYVTKVSVEKVELLGESYANDFEKMLNAPILTAEGMMHSIKEHIKDGSGNREYMMEYLESVLENNPNLLGTWVCFEPNAFDGKDAQFANAPVHDESGRFIPYCVRSEGEIIFEPLVAYDSAGTGDYYQIPKRTRKLAIIEPYMYTINGRETMITSFSVPIIVDGKFIGVVGTDMDLRPFQDAAAKMKPFESGIVKLLANGGTVVSAPVASMIGKNAADIKTSSEDYSSRVLNAVKNGKSETFISHDRQRGKAHYNTLSAVQPVHLSAPWSVAISIPKEKFDEAAVAIRNFGILISTISVIILGIAVFLLLRPMVKLVSKGSRAAEQVSSGDLRLRFSDKDMNHNDEIGRLIQSLVKMSKNLNHIISEIKGSAAGISTATSEITSSSLGLSDRASRQAASIEEVSASVEEMTATIRQNAENASETEAIAKKSARDAEESGAAVRQTIGAMKNIAEKIAVVQEIARQTNLLSLNASIEAARAGEHGKGFAVVASEVQKLAERSSKAAAEIDELSKSSVAVSEEAGQMLDKLVPDIDHTANLIANITTASREQKSGADQINSAIQEMNSSIQHNSSASEQLASTAEELAAQAKSLDELVSFFKVDGHMGTSNVNRKAKKIVEKSEQKKLESAEQQNSSDRLGGRDYQNGGRRNSSGFELDMGSSSKKDDDDDFMRF